MRHRKERRTGLSALLMAAALATSAAAQAPAAKPASGDLKLYVMDCGVLLYNSLAAFGYPDNPKPTYLSDACYLIDDPGKGAMIWDTGIIPDSMWQANGIPPKKFYGEGTVPLAKQMAQVGYSPKDITYVVVSHAHWDHLGNLYQFAGSTWITAKFTRDLLLSDKPTRNTEPAMFAGLKDTRTIMLPDDKDYDVFGDGKVTIIPAPGHTPDSKVLLVKLKNFGPVLLVGDLYHLGDELTHRPALTARGNNPELVASREKIDALAARYKASSWIPHDRYGFAKLKKAPDHYD